MKNGKQIAIGICLFIGLLLAIPTYFTIIDRIDLITNYEVVNGTVISKKQYQTGAVNFKDNARVSSDPIIEKAIIEFVTLKGDTINFEGGIGSNVNTYSLGDDVRVYYDSKNPELAVIKSFFAVWGTPLGLLILTLPWLLAATFIYFRG